MAAVRWVEARSGLPSADCVGQSPLLKLCAERAIVVVRLTGVLTQTKTSGAGRKVRALPLFVPRCAFLVQERWLEVGYGLWRPVGDPGRDFFLP